MSVICDSLPRRRPVRTRRLPCGLLQVVVRDEMECGELERFYDRLPHGRLRRLVYTACAVPDPAVDPVGYIRARWWHPDMIVTREMLAYFVERGRIVYWPDV